jgi:hypothetical protein
LLVTAADKLHNARAILCDYRQLGEGPWTRSSGGRNGVLWYYPELVRALRPHCPRALMDELARVATEPERLAATNRTAVP